MSRFGVAWASTKFKTKWDIFYRFNPSASILDNQTDAFVKYDIPKKFWGADPLVFTFKGEDYLFFELYNCKEKRGSIAVSKIIDNKITGFEIVLDLNIHLSFPFVFAHNNRIYMIPETGQTKDIRLFSSTNFPLEWKEERILLSNVESSDNIVFKDNQRTYLIASIKDGSPSICHNEIYELDDDLIITKKIYNGESSDHGVRNAGPVFLYKNSFIRTGQDCENQDYGKGIVFWRTNSLKDYSEEKILSLNVSDISLCANKKLYSGIHTYSSSNSVEFIDARIRKRRCFVMRVFMIASRILKYIINNCRYKS